MSCATAASEQVLYSFTGGTANLGGGLDGGAVFHLTPTAKGFWKERVIYSFGSGTDGRYPMGGLIPDAAGNLYGTTVGGGTSADDTVFEIVP